MLLRMQACLRITASHVMEVDFGIPLGRTALVFPQIDGLRTIES